MDVRRATLAVVVCVATSSCFEEPVREHLHLMLPAGEVVVVTAVEEVAGPEVAGSNRRLADRLDEARVEIERGWDRWRPLFEQLEPVADRTVVERVDGHTRRSVYSGVVARFEPVASLLSRVGLAAVLEAGGPIHELQLSPAGSPPATWNERQEVERRLDEWSEVVASYLAGAADLYDYLDRRPDRAVPCLSHIFDRHGAGSAPLEAQEEELVVALKDRIEAVTEVLVVGGEEAYSLNELSRRAFDPFPTRLTLTVVGEILESEGFVDHDGTLERPSVDLWSALATLEGRWIAPDLVTAMAAPGPEHLQPEPDPATFAGLPRSHAPPPDGSDVAAEIRSRLAPPDLHRVRWRPAVATADDLEIDDPRQLLDRAMTVLPD